MKTKIVLLLTAVCLLVFLFFRLESCKKKSNNIDFYNYVDTLNAKTSYINLPIILQLSDIEQKLNLSIPKRLHTDTSIAKDNIAIIVEKNGPFKLSNKDQLLYCKAPLKINIELKKQGIFRKNNTDKTHNLNFEIIANLATPISVNENWQLITKTELVSIEWKKKPQISFGPIKINIAGKVEEAIKNESGSVMQQLDKYITEVVSLQKTVSKIWHDIHKPIRIFKFDSSDFVLQAIPKNVYNSNAVLYSNYIKFGIGLTLDSYGKMLDKTDQKSLLATLPALKKSNNLNDSFNLHILNELPYDELSKLLNQELNDKKISYGGYSIYCKKASLIPQGSTLALHIDFDGYVSGSVALKGIPTFNMENSTLNFKSFEYEVSDDIGLLSSSDWFLHSGVKEYLKDYLNVSFKNVTDSLPTIICNAVENSKAGQKVKIKIPELIIYNAQISIQKEYLKLIISGKGSSVLGIENI